MPRNAKLYSTRFEGSSHSFKHILHYVPFRAAEKIDASSQPMMEIPSEDTITSSSNSLLDQELAHVALNPSAKQTVVLLHGIFCSNLEFALVAPHLTDYHLLIVDMPAHSGSRQIKPFTPANAARHVANLIRKHAHGGKAHVVGLSAGGFVALQLGADFSDVALSIWATGATPFKGWQRQIVKWPRVLYTLIGLQLYVPYWIYDRISKATGLLEHDELRKVQQENFTWELLAGGYGSIAEMTVEDSMTALATSRLRTLLLIGEAMDDAPTAKEMANLLRAEGASDSQAVLVKKAQHPWDLQFPELFAKSIRAFIEGEPQPEGIEPL